MNIFEFAKEKELASRQNYLQMAEKTAHQGLRNILHMLADEESKHYDIISQMQRNTAAPVVETSLLADASAVFRKMAGDSHKPGFPVEEIDLYTAAREKEAASRDFYLARAAEIDDPAGKKAMKKLAAEEQKHYVLLDNICDFVSRPASYLEDAEFTYLDDYVQKPL